MFDEFIAAEEQIWRTDNSPLKRIKALSYYNIFTGYDLVERKDDKFWVRIYIGNRYFDEILYENELAELKLMQKEDIE